MLIPAASVIILLMTPQAHSATLNAPGPGGTVQEVIDGASPGDVIEIEPGVYGESIVVGIDLTLRPVIDPYESPVALIAPGYEPAVEVNQGATVRLENLTLAGNYTHSLLTSIGSDVTLDGCVVTQGVAPSGGTIMALGLLTGTNVFIVGGTAYEGSGGQVFSAVGFSCTDCAFEGGSASVSGGGIYADGDYLELIDCTFQSHEADLGAAIYTQATTNTVTRTLFCGDSDPTTFVAADGTTGTISNTYIESSDVGFSLGGNWLLQNLLIATSLTNVEIAPLAEVDVVNSVLFGANVGIDATNGTLIVSHNAYIAVDEPVVGGVPAPSSLIDPIAIFDRFTGTCEPIILAPRFDSEVINAGDGFDPDGSIADIGASGGPMAWGFLHEDADADGYTLALECDDGEAAAYPGALEICDGVDNDCTLGIDVDAIDKSYWFLDRDEDGYGDGATPAGVQIFQCDAPAPFFDGVSFISYAPSGTDCDDGNATIHPGADEICDTIDHNCDSSPTFGAVNATDWHIDADGDGYGDAQILPVRDCTSPGVDYIANIGDDCDDGDPTISPGAPETCDGFDNNCSGNELDASNIGTTFADNDLDGYPNLNDTHVGCQAPAGFIPARADGAADCDDTESQAFPTNIETCDGVDNDCNRVVDDLTKSPPLWYADDDGDGFGSAVPGTSISTDCPDPGYVSSSTDCDDAEAATFPGAEELCNGIDDDCSGQVDDGPTTTYYVDIDGDGYGSEVITASCEPEGVVTVGGDCQDGFADINPGALEVPGNDIDEDCVDGPENPASAPKGQPAASGCQCNSSEPTLWIWLLLFLPLLRRSNSQEVL